MGFKQKKEIIYDLFFELASLLGFPISLLHIGINFSPKNVHKKTRHFRIGFCFAPLIHKSCSRLLALSIQINEKLIFTHLVPFLISRKKTESIIPNLHFISLILLSYAGFLITMYF